MARDREWVFRDQFGVRWHLSLGAPDRPRDASRALASESQLRTVVHSAFNGWGSGALGHRLQTPHAAIVAAFDAVSGRRLSDAIARGSLDRSGLAAWQSAIRDALGNALRGGFIRLEAERPVATPFTLPETAPDTVPTPTVALSPSFVELKVVDEIGEPIEGIDVAFGTGGSRRVVPTNTSGVARLDDVTTGFVSASIASVAQLRDKLKPRLSKPRTPKLPVGPDVFVAQLERTIAPVSLETERPTTLVVTPLFRCNHIAGAHFAFGRSFVLRGALDTLAGIAEDLSDENDHKAMIFGHTDTSGSEALNKELSERRAKALFALFTHDHAMWEELFEGSADGANWHEKWDLEEAQHMLNALGVTDDSGRAINEKGIRDASTKEAIHRFQAGNYPERPAEQAPLPQSNFLGVRGRKELFLAYAKRISRKPVDATRFSQVGDGKFMGCGEFNPLSLAAKDAESRRATVFVFDPAAEPQALPCKLRALGPCHANIGPVPDKVDPDGKPPLRCKIFRDIATTCPCQGGADLSHDLVVRIPFSLEVVNGFQHVLILESDDGTITRTKTLKADARALDEEESEIFFAHLPPSHAYRMRAEGVREPYQVFPFTPFEELSTLSQALSPIDEEQLVAIALAADPDPDAEPADEEEIS